MQIGLAEHNGPGFAQRSYQGRILARLEVPQRRCSRSSREVLRIDAVLDGDRHAVQGAELATGAALRSQARAASSTLSGRSVMKALRLAPRLHWFSSALA